MRGAIGKLALLCGLAIGLSAPLVAHGDHKKHPNAGQMEAHEASAHPTPGHVAAAAAPRAQMAQMMEREEKDRSKMNVFERALNWIGRLHVIVVHFPLAFFPAALFAAIVCRRHAAFERPTQFLVVAGAIFAPVAALLGWLDAGWSFADDDWLLHFHRWIGTAIGIMAPAIGIWAARRPDRSGSTAMIVALAVITAALIVQGWFGGAMVHGLHHLDW